MMLEGLPNSSLRSLNPQTTPTVRNWSKVILVLHTTKAYGGMEVRSF